MGFELIPKIVGQVGILLLLTAGTWGFFLILKSLRLQIQQRLILLEVCHIILHLLTREINVLTGWSQNLCLIGKFRAFTVFWFPIVPSSNKYSAAIRNYIA